MHTPNLNQPPGPDQPHLIFSTELDGAALLAALGQPGVLEWLAAQGHMVALALVRRDATYAQIARLLNQHGIGLIAALCLPPEEGLSFNLQNYPRAAACYQQFHAWAQAEQLHFEAVGISIEPPLEDVASPRHSGPRALLRRLWLARENILYPSAQAAYAELLVAIRLDGYEVHAYQMPVIADDRRLGIDLIQRALDIIDLPADVDVLMCSSSLPSGLLGSDLGGALIASYGAGADALGVGSVGNGDPAASGRAPLAWRALRRDMLLAAHYTDTIYVYSLEDCVARGLLPLISGLPWGTSARAALGARALIGLLRALLLLLLLLLRFGGHALAWAGWGLALLLWLRGRRKA